MGIIKKIKQGLMVSGLRRGGGGLRPVSRLFGLDRGNPIDRYYIEKFLSGQGRHIRGTVFEIAEDTYTRKFGTVVDKSIVLHSEAGTAADLVCDLETGAGLTEGVADCFIMTQTLPFIFDVRSAAINSVRMLKPGGRLLVTVPGITQISRFDYDRWGHFWSFTDMSLRRLFEEAAPGADISVRTYGNVKSASCFLYGMAEHELSEGDLDKADPDYQVVITAVLVKP